jgi:predicted transcriptional regulator
MPTKSTKDRIIETLRELPADSSFEDAIERIVFLARVEEGLSQLDAGRAVPHGEVRRRLNR